ncbi:hypothetical protein [Actinomadura sp. HBU206391]|uniref:hypothetical protein n=1 Tax=Actinomadura sp. HBU206391 TaxID=2731692 RepID=UPI00164F2C1F|nr:hypothetical protein [Actinomadura sp. HBU206391]MBC6460842.1 hypothetical protein [Actinomadura sp. HBU206391]
MEVHDAGRTLPRPRRAALEDVDGRGLSIVGRVADGHGVHRTSCGKVSWFTIVAWPDR